MTLADWAGTLPLVVGLLLVALSALVLRASHARTFNIAFAILYFLSGTKSVSEGLLFLSPRLQEQAPAFPAPLFWLDLSFVCASFMLPLFFLLVLHFPRPTRVLQAFPGLAFLLFVPCPLLLYLWFSPEAGFARVDLAQVLNGLSLLVTGAALAILARTYRTTLDPIGRTRAGYLLTAFGLLAAANLVAVVLVWLRDANQVPYFLWVSPIVDLVVAGIIGYAIVKYQVLEVEVRVKVGLKYAAVTTITVTVFFVANNTFQNYLEAFLEFTQLSYLISALLAGLIFLPLQRLADLLLTRLFPATAQPKEKYRHQRSHDVFHAQVAYILRDGHITDRERRFLDTLRDNLGLTPQEAQEIEARAMQVLAAERPDLVPGTAAARANA